MNIKSFSSILIALSVSSSLSAINHTDQFSVNASSQTMSMDSMAAANDFAHFSFPLNVDSQIKTVHQPESTSSDEYWFQTTGKALNQGVAINTTQAGALIRITQGKVTKNSKLAADIDTSLLRLFSKQQPDQSAVAKMISKNQLAQTSVFDNTVAIKTSTTIGNGALVLKTSQPLFEDDIYMVSVKEKGSPFRLQLNLNGQSYAEKSRILATAQLSNSGKALSAKSIKATLIAPNGKRSPISFSTNKAGKINFNLTHPKNAIAPINGLYEILVEATGETNSLNVQRNAKLALAFTRDTARIAKVALDPMGVYADLKLTVNQPSRFEARAILYATNYDGDLVPVMETHSAQSLVAGKNILRMPFNQKILANSQLNAPFEMRNVRLIDQKQLGLIDTFSNKVLTH